MKTPTTQEINKPAGSSRISPKTIRALCVGATLGLAPEASAISISSGLTGGSGDVDNLLFDQEMNSGALVRGSLNTTPGFLVDFTSTSGDLVAPASGQVRIEALNDPFTFTNLSFGLTEGSTFTKAQLNVNSSATATDAITFSIYYSAGISPFVSMFDLTGTGQNQFTILAEGSERITSIMLDTSVPIQDVKQVRIGGASRATSVPDGGTTAALLGVALLGLGGIHRKLGGSCA